jgi:hypothetical protein
VEHLYKDLGHRDRGDVVEVTLDKGANVRLMDSGNYNAYKQGRQHRAVGGLATRSPVRLGIPSSGRWHLAIDMQGLRGGTLRHSVRILPAAALQPLPPIRETRPGLQSIANAAAEAAPEHPAEERDYDVFISHASEDKDTVVRPLAEALREHGLEVWYDEFTLKIGDSLRRKIDSGIARSRFGIVVLSPPFLAKGWPQYELDGLVTKSVTGQQILLPLWHGISKDEVMSHSPSLADKVALRTSDYTIAEIAEEITSVVRPS